jgi:hypothetical protein
VLVLACLGFSLLMCLFIEVYLSIELCF